MRAPCWAPAPACRPTRAPLVCSAAMVRQLGPERSRRPRARWRRHCPYPLATWSRPAWLSPNVVVPPGCRGERKLCCGPLQRRPRRTSELGRSRRGLLPLARGRMMLAPLGECVCLLLRVHARDSTHRTSEVHTYSRSVLSLRAIIANVYRRRGQMVTLTDTPTRQKYGRAPTRAAVPESGADGSQLHHRTSVAEFRKS
jgi:hypothetical protein